MSKKLAYSVNSNTALELSEILAKDKSSAIINNENEWKFTVDQSGNGVATVKFLPSQYSRIPWIKLFSHGFKWPTTGQWFIENSPATDKERCPASELRFKLKANGDPRNELIKRVTRYVVNILVIEDKLHPENNGKVMIYRCPKSVFSMIEDRLEERINVFDIENAVNFRLKAHKKGNGYRTYERSSFSLQQDTISPELAKEYYEQTHNLEEFAAIKPVKEIETRLATVCRDVLGSQQNERPSKAASVQTPPKANLNYDTAKSAKDWFNDADESSKFNDL